MQAKSREKTKSALSDRAKVLIVAGIGFLFLTALFSLFVYGLMLLPRHLQTTFDDRCPVSFESSEFNGLDTQLTCVDLELAVSEQQKAIGLSKYRILPESQGMLFVYDKPEKACIWMKDMSFSIDIVWLNEDEKITKIKENVSPQTYPDIFCSKTDDTAFVIELVAGVADKAGLKVGDTLKF